MALQEWLARIRHLRSGPEIVLGLERVRPVFARLEVQPKVPVILVGGTNGKGSTVAFCDAILRAAGYRVARYTSPHLLRFNERIVIHGREAEDEELVTAFEAVEAARIAAGGSALTFFEYTTLAAFWLFSRHPLDAWLIEVGLGGRLDATNVLDADCAVITSIGLDHMEWLGPDREAIAREKAGIFRAGQHAVIAEPDPPQSLEEAVRRLGARAVFLGQDFGWQRQADTPAQWSWWHRTSDGKIKQRSSLPIPALRGPYQLGNAAAALMALESLKEPLPISSGAIREGLLQVDWPGRFQVLPGRPTVILDVAHNEHAARALAEALASMAYFPATHAVFSMLADKDVTSVVRTLQPRIEHWHVAALNGARALGLPELLTGLKSAGVSERSITAYTSIQEAYAGARSAAGEADRIVVFGSFLTVAAAMTACPG